MFQVVMKKFIITIVALLAFTAVSNAQPRALGVRGGYGVELSYQHNINNNFIEADLGWAPGELNIVAIYDFLFASAGNFNFYAGPGARVGTFRTSNGVDGLNIGVSAQIGAEYAIQAIPLNVSLDWRPVVNFLGEGNQRGFNGNYLALGLRFRF